MIKKQIKVMNKRGDLIIGALILVGLVAFGGFVYSAEKIVSENRYVGDMSTNLYYDLKTCETKQIERANIRNFEGEQEAIDNGFRPASCVG